MSSSANMTISAQGTIASWSAAAESITGYSATNIVGRHFSEVLNFSTCSLGESDAMFRRIVETTSEGIWTINLLGTVEYANPRLAALLGYSREEIIGQPVTKFVQPTEHVDIENIIKNSPPGQSSLSDWRLVKFDGSTLLTRTSSSPITDHQGKIIGRLAVVTDLSERRLAENERDQFFSNSLDMLGIASVDGYFLKLNPEFENALGWKFEDLLSRPYLEFVHPDDIQATLREMQKLAEGIPTLAFENRYRCKNGEYKWLSWRTTQVKDGRCFFVARDVTEHKLTAQRLRKSAEMHSALADLGSLALQKVDLPTVFRACIELSAKVLGFEFSALAVILPNQREGQIAATYGWPMECINRKATLEIGKGTHSGYTLANGKMVYFENIENENRFDTSHLKKIGVKSGIAVLVPRQDDIFGVITMHCRSQSQISLKQIHFLQSMANVLGSAVERRQLESQLKTSDRLASVGALAAGVAHEINNPMSFVITNLDLMASLLSSPSTDVNTSEILTMISQAQQGAERVRLVVKDLKTFSGSSDDKLEAVKLENVLDFSVRMAANQIRYVARLTTNYDQSPAVMINENRLGQVLLNILVNAAHAIPEGLADQNEVNVWLGTDAIGQAVIEIRDTGAGIPEAIMPQIFDPFFTTKPVGMGTGLGLSICRNIIAKLNGELSIESQVGVGTKVRIVLPAAANQSTAAGKSKIDLPVPLLSMVQRKILILDDEALLVETLGRALSNDHIVSTTVSPAAALKLIENDQEAFDVILCDMMMAEMTGMDFYQQLRIRFPGTESRLVFMTGGTFTSQAQEFLNDVPNIRLEKPFNLKEIRALLQQPLATLWRDENEKFRST